jgi:hypothetical protein
MVGRGKKEERQMTGHTHELVERDLSFEQFALLCARAFGALITMRDDRLDAPVPVQIEPESYHRDELAKAEAELAKWDAMTGEGCLKWAETEKCTQLDYHQNCLLGEQAVAEKLSAVLAKATAWTPPTEEHQGLKRFVVEQITASMPRVDSYHAEAIASLRSTTPEAMVAERRMSLARDVEYHRKGWAEEQHRAATRNAWLQSLRSSLKL